jgi:methyl-accepting chemotaxis protein
MSIKAKLVTTCLLLTTALIIVLGLMTRSTEQVKINGIIYKDIIRGKDLVADILPPPEYALEAYCVALQALAEEDSTKVPAYEERFRKLQDEYTVRHDYWAKELPAGNVRELLLQQSYTPALLFFTTATKEYFPALTAGNHEAAARILKSVLTPAYETHRKAIDAIVPLSNAEGSAIEQHAADRLHNATVQSVTIALIFVLLIISVFFFMIRSLTRQLRKAITIAHDIAAGNVEMEIQVDSRDEIGQLMTAMKQMVDTIREMVLDVTMLSRAATAGQLATRADTSKHQGQFQSIVTGFNETLDAIVGPLNMAAEYVDRISKGDIPPKITQSYCGDFNEIRLNLNNCIDNIQMLITDARMLATSAVAGNLATRANTSRHQGSFRVIIAGVNDTLDAVIGPLNMAAEYVDRISKGDIPPPDNR